MRFILTLTIVFLMNFEVVAQSKEPKVDTIGVSVLVIKTPPLKFLKATFDISEKTAILYKMKENIIRRELSFTPKKKWMKWS